MNDIVISEPAKWSADPTLVKFELSLDMYKLPMPVLERLRAMMAAPHAAVPYLEIRITGAMIWSAGFEEFGVEQEQRLVLTGETSVTGTIDIQ